MTEATDTKPTGRIKYPPGFRLRRGCNWGALGLMYAAYYMNRYNLRMAFPGMRQEFGFSREQLGWIDTGWKWSYAFGQFFNGLFTDRIGGKAAMLIGAAVTIVMNLAFGAASYPGLLSLFVLIRSIDGYFQAFGAPGMIKTNAAWFNRTERGTFAGIFGIMIQLGVVGNVFLSRMVLKGWVLPLLVAGFVWKVEPLHWRWLFWAPTVVAAAVAVLLAIVVKETPEEAGYHGVVTEEHGHAGQDVRISLKESFMTIAPNPLVWLYAGAYFCTGVLRHGIETWFPLYMKEAHGLDLTAGIVAGTLAFKPFVSSAGSIISGVISDKLFGGRRSPVAAFLYFSITVIILATMPVKGLLPILASIVFLYFAVNATHSIVGAAAPMDIGGRKMAGFASGVIDSFQYFGGGLAGFGMGRLIDKFGWTVWLPSMAIFGIIGGAFMIAVMRRHKRLTLQTATAARR